MAQYQLRFQTCGNALGSAQQGPHESLTLATTLTFAADPEGGASLVAPVVGLDDIHIEEVWLALAGGTPENARTYATQVEWFLEDPLGAQAWFANSEPTTRDLSGFAAGGPFGPTPQVVLGGAALASFAVAPTTVNAMIRYSSRYSTREGGGANQAYSWMQAVAFLDDNAGESLADPTTFLRRLEHALAAEAGSSQVLGVASTGETVSLRSCGFSGLDRRGSAWISTGDVGANPEQIPPDWTSNTAARFAFHPSAFWPTLGGVQRRIELMEPTDTNTAAIDTQAGAPVILVVDGDVVASRWLFVIRGQAITTVILHPTELGVLRRPRDVWNQVIVPGMRSSAVGQGLVMYQDQINAPDRTFHPVGILGDLAELSYAHFLEPLGDTDSNVYTWQAQTA